MVPGLIDFFNAHPLIKPNTFLGDAAFDTLAIYKNLLQDLHFKKLYIPLNNRSKLVNNECSIDENGIPCCPYENALLIKYEGKEKLKTGLMRYKFVCPKMNWIKVSKGKYKRKTFCENPCTTSESGRMFYIYPEKDFRAYPGVLRGTDDWEQTYKIRSVVEQSINHFKASFCIANRKTQNQQTLHSDLFLAGFTQLLTVLLADNIQQYQYLGSLKPLIA